MSTRACKQRERGEEREKQNSPWSYPSIKRYSDPWDGRF
jgi:hypothetical protein